MLLEEGQINKVVWHFYESPITGKWGPSHNLAKELLNNGIKIVYHFTY